VRWDEQDGTMQARLSGILIDSYAPGEPAGYPTLCKGRFTVEGERGYVLEEPTSLNAVSLLPTLIDIGIAAIKIEGRQRSPRYVADVVGCCARPSTMHAAIRSGSRRARNGRPRWAATPKATRSRRAPTTARGADATRRPNHSPAIPDPYGNRPRLNPVPSFAILPRSSLPIALGPLLYYWPRAAVLQFYASVATAPVDRVYLGEAVCTRRHEMRLRTGSKSRRCCARQASRWCCRRRCWSNPTAISL
jgi:hypothetical protein